MSEMNKYCDGLDCAFCDEKEPCIYKIANKHYQALQEIKEEMNIINKCEYCIDNPNGYCIGFNQCTCDCFKRIHQIIEKVENVSRNS